MGTLRVLVCVFAALSAAPAPRRPLGPGDHWLSLRHDGRTRGYLVHVPPRAASGRALPVLLSFHGAGGSAAGQQRFTRTDSLADREGFPGCSPGAAAPAAARCGSGS